MVATGLEKTMDPAHTGAGILIHSGDRHSPRHWSSQHNTTQYVISQFLISVPDLRDLNVSQVWTGRYWATISRIIGLI